MLVETSLGTFKIRPPSLGGWRRILECLPERDYETLFDALLLLTGAPDDDPQKQRDAETAAGKKLLAILPRLPTAAAVFARECLGPADGAPGLALKESQAEDLTDEDFDRVLEALKDRGILRDLSARLKKRLRGLGMRRTQAAVSESGQS